MRQGRASEAAAVLSNASRIQPKDPVLLNNLGMCLMVGRQCDQALQCFTKAAGLRPESRKYRANMAAALGLLGRQEESLALLRQVLSEPQAEHNAQVLRDAAGKIPLSAPPLPD
jgi:Flp pilus assembly protein TadD